MLLNIRLLVMLCALCLGAVTARAEKPSWDDMPEKLKNMSVTEVKAAAAGNDSDAQTLLGLFCENGGNGEKKDLNKARQWYEKAAQAGHPVAAVNLGAMYAHGRGVKQDYGLARKWYTVGAEKNHPVAQCNLGILYAKAQGVKQDCKKAGSWFRKAAKQGYGTAELNLGLLYTKGCGVKQNDKTAVSWFKKAAAHGEMDAQFLLGYAYEFGKGVKINMDEALKWYGEAVKKGSVEAAENLCLVYATGRGVPEDMAVAYTFFLVAMALERPDKDDLELEKMFMKELGEKAQAAAQQAAEAMLAAMPHLKGDKGGHSPEKRKESTL